LGLLGGIFFLLVVHIIEEFLVLGELEVLIHFFGEILALDASLSS